MSNIYFNPMTYKQYKEGRIDRGCNFICPDIACDKIIARFKNKYNIREISFSPTRDFIWDACICMIEEDNDGVIITKYPVRYYRLEKKFKDIYLIDLIQILSKQQMVYISEEENNKSYTSKYDRVVDIPEKYYNYKVLAVSQSSNGTYYIKIE